MKTVWYSLVISIITLIVNNEAFGGNVLNASRHLQNKADAPWVLPSIIGIGIVFVLAVAVTAFVKKKEG